MARSIVVAAVLAGALAACGDAPGPVPPPEPQPPSTLPGGWQPARPIAQPEDVRPEELIHAVAPAGVELLRADAARARDGAVAAAWIEQRGAAGNGRYTLRAGWRLPDGTVVRTRAIARATGGIPQMPGLSDVRVAAEPDGAALVVYADQDTVRATELPRRGRPRRQVRVAPTTDLTDLALAVAPSGLAVLAWGAQDGGEERNLPHRVSVAVREPGAARFGPPTLLDRGGVTVDPLEPVRVDLDRDGTARVTWFQDTEMRAAVRRP